jgi:hypothetical protein
MRWSWSYDLGHDYKMLTQIVIGLFFKKYFHTIILFRFHPSTLGLLKIKLFFFFLLSMRMAWPHDPGRGFTKITWIGSGLLHYFIFILNFINILLIALLSFYFYFYFLFWISSFKIVKNWVCKSFQCDDPDFMTCATNMKC